MLKVHFGAIHKKCLHQGGWRSAKCRQLRKGGEGGWLKKDVHTLKDLAGSFLKLLKQGIVYVIESK